MFYRIINIIGGLLSIWSGFKMYRDKMELHYGFPIPPETGLLVGIVGVILIYFGVFTKRGLHIGDNNFLICLNCQTPVRSDDVTDLMCPQCQGILEKLDGFYDRHPELKEKNKKGF